MQPTLFAFDINSHLARVFKAQTNNDEPPSYPGAFHLGEPVFCLKPLLSLVEKEMRIMRNKGVENTHVVIVFDDNGKNHRHAMYPAYKATRPPKPKEWIRQEALAFEMFQALGYTCLRIPGVESDDVIATICTKLSQVNIKSVIFTRDKDIMSCCDENISVYSGIDKKWMRERDVAEKFGVPVMLVLDYLAIRGDTSDNIPGIYRAGDAAAKAMLSLADLHTLIENPEMILSANFRDRKSIAKWVTENKEKVLLSRALVELKKDVELNINLKDMVRRQPHYDDFLSGFMRPQV